MVISNVYIFKIMKRVLFFNKWEMKLHIWEFLFDNLKMITYRLIAILNWLIAANYILNIDADVIKKINSIFIFYIYYS